MDRHPVRMPRAPRIEYADALYHVASRGNGRADIFKRDEDRQRFLHQLQDNLKTFGVMLYAYVLMRNHYHLLLRTPGANLSRFMQRLNTSYALYARYKHGRPGHQLQGRYLAKVVQDERYLLGITRYIHLNPVKTSAARQMSGAQRVAFLENYRWSSYPGYVRAAKVEPWVHYDVLDYYRQGRVGLRRAYRAYVHAMVLEDDQPLLELLKGNAHAIGDENFIEDTESRLRRRKRGDDRDRDVQWPRPQMPLTRIDKLVSEACGIGAELLHRHGNEAGASKSVAIEMACRFSGLNQRQVGAHYGGIGSAAVSKVRRKFRGLPADPRLRRLMGQIEKRLERGS